MLTSLPRILIAAPRSGSGKTTLSCALMGALHARGLRVLSCKCGPDYIDPSFHNLAGACAHVNLDPYFQGEGLLRDILAHAGRGCDVACIEGAMGYYDGVGASTQASAWDVAHITQTPTLLVLDARGAAASLAAQVLGFVRMREPSHIAGVVLNNASPRLAAMLAPLIERECGVPVLGALPHDEGAVLPSRHLGLVCAEEVDGIAARLAALAALAQDNLDIDAILALAQAAPGIDAAGTWPPGPLFAPGEGPLLAVARDEAFSFYYAEELEGLEALGARLAFFSPLHDAGLPKDAQGLFLGGGYPELHARELAGNAAMLACMRRALEQGMPTLAECGGFLYLHEWLEDEAGQAFPLIGAVPGRAAKPPARQARFGYIEVTARQAGVLGPAGTALHAHEFHRWDSPTPGTAFDARKPLSTRAWQAGYHTPSLYAGFPHLYLPSNLTAAGSFLRACAAWGGADSKAGRP